MERNHSQPDEGEEVRRVEEERAGEEWARHHMHLLSG